jgi:sulfoxide reductase heme-binding subunit YedZ
MSGHLFWIVSRGAGIAALLLSSGAVGLGLLMSGRLLRARLKDARALHEALSLATLVALVVHATALLGDKYLAPSLADITIPFVFAYRSLWTGVGIIAGWLLVVLGLSFYLRARIGVQRWRKLHRLTALAWVLAIAHSLGAGTDAGRWWFLGACAIVVGPALALLVGRLRQGHARSQEALRTSSPFSRGRNPGRWT